MSIIDSHCHAFPDSLAERAITQLTARGAGQWNPSGDGTITGLLRSMDKAAIEAGCVCAIATKPGQIKGILDWQESILSDRIWPFASLHPHDDQPRDWIKRFANAGIQAIKLHPMYQDFLIDDPAMDAVYAAAAEFDLGVTFHSGYDIGFMNDTAADRAAPHRIANVLDRFPTLRVLCTHLGGWKMWDQVQQHLVGREVFLETSFTFGYIDESQMCEIITQHGAEKICFGTDWPWRDQSTELQRLRQLELDSDTIRTICEVSPRKFLSHD